MPATSANLADESVHLCVTSPPYFNAKMYSENYPNDLGNIHDLDVWFAEIGRVWAEVFRVLQGGRKFFLNIMNLPVKEKSSYRTLNLVGKSIDLVRAGGFCLQARHRLAQDQRRARALRHLPLPRRDTD